MCILPQSWTDIITFCPWVVRNSATNPFVCEASCTKIMWNWFLANRFIFSVLGGTISIIWLDFFHCWFTGNLKLFHLTANNISPFALVLLAASWGVLRVSAVLGCYNGYPNEASLKCKHAAECETTLKASNTSVSLLRASDHNNTIVKLKIFLYRLRNIITAKSPPYAAFAYLYKNTAPLSEWCAAMWFEITSWCSTMKEK